jgi:hypothetical protein
MGGGETEGDGGRRREAEGGGGGLHWAPLGHGVAAEREWADERKDLALVGVWAEPIWLGPTRQVNSQTRPWRTLELAVASLSISQVAKFNHGFDGLSTGWLIVFGGHFTASDASMADASGPGNRATTSRQDDKPTKLD